MRQAVAKQEVVNTLRSLIERVRSEQPTSVAHTGSDIIKVASTFPKNTSIGSDLWTFKEIAQCNISDLDRFARLISSCQRSAAPPKQSLLNILNLNRQKDRRAQMH